MRSTLGAWRAMSSAPMYTTHAQPEPRASGRRRDPVLPGTGLRDDAPLAQAAWRASTWPRHVVDLVRARYGSGPRA